MKRSLPGNLGCLDCRASDWDVEVFAENAREIRSGKLRCRACRAEYAIDGGIVQMLRELSGEVACEKSHSERLGYLKTASGESYQINQETIERFRNVFLTLPTGDGGPMFQPGGCFDNQAQNAARFFETLNLLNLKGNEKVLELGASFGWSAWRFAQRGCDVVALDVTNYLAVSDLYFEEDDAYFERVMADMNRLPFKDESFDLIFSHSVIHHCQDLAGLFRTFYRLLRPGGRVVALHECAFGLLEDKSGAALKEAIEEGYNENAYTLPQWKRGARDGGFHDIHFHFFSFVNDYTRRKKDRKAPLTFKLKLAAWIQKHPTLHRLINDLSVAPRILLRPKNWMMTAVKTAKP